MVLLVAFCVVLKPEICSRIHQERYLFTIPLLTNIYYIQFMVPYQKEKIENAILFFAKEHRAKTHQYLAQTFLYKYLAFLDFKSLEKTGHPALGLKYMAMKLGPVPIDIYNNRHNYKTDLFQFISFDNDEKIQIVAKDNKKTNFDYFSQFEINLMKELIEIYADSFVKSGTISDASHEAIKAWRKAFSIKPNSIIDYSYAFDNDVQSTPSQNLTFQEQVYKTFKKIAES